VPPLLAAAIEDGDSCVCAKPSAAARIDMWPALWIRFFFSKGAAVQKGIGLLEPWNSRIDLDLGISFCFPLFLLPREFSIPATRT